MQFNKKPTAEEFENGGASKPEPAPALDPKEAPVHGYNMRLNKYELFHLDRLAKDQDLSIQRLLRRIIRNYIKHRPVPKAAQ